MAYEQQIKDFILSKGAAVVGIASADRLDNVPYGRTAKEIMPGAKSVIVFGSRMPFGAVAAKFKADKGNVDARNVYGRYAHGSAFTVHQMYITYITCHFIENLTHATAMPTMVGPISIGRPFSHRHAAVAAGLGEFSWQGAVITPKYGPRIRFGAIVTNLELTPDPMYEGPKLCDPSKCHVCSEGCPACALPKFEENKTRTWTVGGKEYKVSDVDVNACRVASYGLMKQFGADKDYVKDLHPTDEELQNAINEHIPAPGSLTREPAWYCDKCVVYCPVGMEVYKKNGLI